MVRRERDQPWIVAVVRGALDAGAVPSLRRALVRALRTRAPILVDLTEAMSIHRDGLTTLVAAYWQAKQAGTRTQQTCQAAVASCPGKGRSA